MRHSLTLCAVLLAVTGCAEEEPTTVRHGVELKPIESFDSPLWVGELAEDDPVVARVEGTPITQSMVEQQMALSGDTDPKAVLERIIEFELLARQAMKPSVPIGGELPESKYTDSVVGDAMRKALARRWIEASMEENISPADIPDEFVQKAYDMMRGRYDHYERFIIRDVQLLCCHTDNYEACFSNDIEDPRARTEHVELCLEHHKEAAAEMRKLLERAQSRDEFKRIFEGEVSAAIPGPDLLANYGVRPKVQDYDFQYDVDETYEKQFEKIRYHIFYKEIMDGVKNAWFDNNLEAPFITPVIRTPLGYHVLYVSEVQPEQHWAIDHPEVQKEIRENIYTPWRQVYFTERVEDLCKKAGCEIHHQRLVALQDKEEGK